MFIDEGMMEKNYWLFTVFTMENLSTYVFEHSSLLDYMG